MTRTTIFDLETMLIRPGLQAPPPVCVSWAEVGDGGESGLEPMYEGVHRIRRMLSGGCQVEGTNIRYDMLCLVAWHPSLTSRIFTAYQELRVFDTSVRERIAEIQGLAPRGGQSLEMLCHRHGVVPPEKNDGTRTSYGPLLGKPISEYPPEHRSYALADSLCNRKVAIRQKEKYGHDVDEREVAVLTRKMFWLGCASAWGMNTDGTSVDAIEERAREEFARLEALAGEHGFLRFPTERMLANDAAKGEPPRKPTKNMKAIQTRVFLAYDGSPPLTDGGAVATGRVTLEESGDPVLETLSEWGQWGTVVNKDMKILRGAERAPAHTRYSLKDTTRTGSSNPNLQNMANVGGIRECFIAPEGCAIISADYSALEMCTLAQTLINVLGEHHMAEQINGGVDLHAVVGAEILGVDLEYFQEALDLGVDQFVQARQLAKVPNFGKPGGMANQTLVSYARGLKPKVNITPDQAEQLGQAWVAARPDVVRYLREYVPSLANSEGRYDAPIPGTNIIRRNITYCAAANTAFQGLGAVVTDLAGWALVQEMYCDTGRLRDCRIMNFVHDEFLISCPVERVAEVAPIVEEIMVQSGAPAVPDVRLRVEAVASYRWSKKAKAVRDEQGRLQIWE